MLDLTRRTTVPVLTLALAAAVLSGCSRDNSDTSPDPDARPDSSIDSSPSPDPAAPDDESGETDSPDGNPRRSNLPDMTPQEVKEVEESTEDFYDDQIDALADPKETPEPTDHPHITADALEDLVNQVAEFQDNGWKMVGEPEVVWQRVVRRSTSPSGVIVRACVDNSDVRVMDRNGDEVPNSRPSTPRTLNVLTVVRKDGRWVVADQRIAQNPDC